MPGPGRPRSLESHAAIMDSAIALVREVGFDAVTMEGIAARAGVGKATLYRWWPSRELLIVEALGRLVRSIPVPDTGDPVADLRFLMHATMGMYQDPATGMLLSGLVAAMARHPAVATAVRDGFAGRMRESMRVALRRAVARGILRRRTDLDLALDMLTGPLFHRYLMLGQPIDDDFTRAVVDAVLRAFAPTTRAVKA